MRTPSKIGGVVHDKLTVASAMPTPPVRWEAGPALPCAGHMSSAPVMGPAAFKAYLCGCVSVEVFGVFSPGFGDVPSPG